MTLLLPLIFMQIEKCTQQCRLRAPNPLRETKRHMSKFFFCICALKMLKHIEHIM